jgi:hypothetical protein
MGRLYIAWLWPFSLVVRALPFHDRRVVTQIRVIAFRTHGFGASERGARRTHT